MSPFSATRHRLSWRIFAVLTAGWLSAAPDSSLQAHPSLAEHGTRGSEKQITEKMPGRGPLEQKITEAQEKLADPRLRALSLEQLGWLFVTKARQDADHQCFDRAVACADLLEKEFPKRRLEALLLRGHVQIQNHQFAEAEESARTLIAQRGNVFDYGLLGDTLLDQGRLDAAAAAFQKMIDLRPGLPAYLRVAELRWMKGDVEGCLEMMLLAVKSGSPRQAEAMAWAHSRLSHFLLTAGRAKEAAAAAEHSLALLPSYAPGLRARALAQMALLPPEQWVAAEAALAQASSAVAEPGYLWPLWECQTALGHREAAEVTRQTLVGKGRTEDPRTVALFLATTGGDAGDAVKLARAELERRRDPYTLDIAAWALHQAAQGDAQKSGEAQKLMDEALASGVRDPRLLWHASILRDRQEERAETRRALQEVLALRAGLLPSEIRLVRERLANLADMPSTPSSPVADVATSNSVNNTTSN